MQSDQERDGGAGEEAGAAQNAGNRDSQAKGGSPKVASRLSNKSKKAGGGKAADESPMRKNDSKKNLVSRTKQRKQGEGSRNPRESTDAADDKSRKANNNVGEEPKSPDRSKKVSLRLYIILIAVVCRRGRHLLLRRPRAAVEHQAHLGLYPRTSLPSRSCGGTSRPRCVTSCRSCASP